MQFIYIIFFSYPTVDLAAKDLKNNNIGNIHVPERSEAKLPNNFQYLNVNYIGFLNSKIILIEYLWNNFINLKIHATPCICRGTHTKLTEN